jgi:L-alanine-DL-glutamate epimerase-like enolase superfamily enzyme
VLRIELITLRLTEPFRIAHGTSTERQAVRLSFGDAVGEAPFVPYYHESPEAAVAALSTLSKPFDELTADAPRAARLAHDLLKHDLLARQSHQPLWQYLGLPDPNGRVACRSLGIPTDLGAFRDRVASTAKQFQVLKLKLGSGDLEHDLAIVRTAREAAPHVTLIADANGGWSPADAAVLIPQLAAHGLAMIEQPVTHKLGLAPWEELRATLSESLLPIFADESVQTSADVDALAPLVDGVSVKLLKCGTIAEALATIRKARELGKEVLLSCMIETSIGITAAAHLAGLADYIDLDGHLYLANDSGGGVTFDSEGRLDIPFP